MKEIIKAMADLIQSQDNLGTDHPIYMVQELKRIYGLDPDYADDKIVVLDQHCDYEEIDPPPDVDIYDWRDQQRDLGHTVTGYRDEWHDVQPFFTRAGALNYLKINGHNLRRETRIYVKSAFRNAEWQAIRELLLEMK